MKILFLAPHLSTGGMPQFLLKRIQSLQEYTDNEYYVVEYQCYSLDFVVQRNAIKSLLKENFITLPDNKMDLFKVIEEWQPDIVHIDEMSEMFDRQMISKLYSHNRKYRIVETCHNVSFNPNEEKLFHPDLYTFCTPYHEQTFANMESKFVTIEYPIDKKDNLSIPNGKNVLNVGLWTKGKNQGEGIEIARKYPDFTFNFIGNQAGNFREYWEPLMKDLPPNVKVWGERDDVSSWMERANIFMFNSTWECNPLVLREAISYGLPIIARDLPQYGDMFTKYLQPINTDLNTIKANYEVPTDNTTPIFAFAHENVYSEILKLPIQKQKVSITQHFVDNPFLEIKGADIKDDVDNDSISIILAHPNTEFRKKLLKNCISKLNTPIILSANYPVEEETQSLCNYVIYTKENPLLYKSEFEKYNVGYYHWHMNEKGEKTYTLFEKEHGYCVYSLMRNGVEYAKKLGYDKVNIINYDYEISKSTIKRNVDELDTNDFVVYKYGSNSYEIDSYCSAFLSAKTDAILSFVTKFKDKKDYYTNGPEFNILEVKLYDFLNENNFKIKTLPFEDLKKNNKVDIEGIDYTNEKEKNRTVLDKRYLVEFYDDNDICIYSNHIDINSWIKLNRQWFTKWKVKVWDNGELIYENTLNYKDKRVFITIESKSLGDTLAWAPYALEFQKKHNCKVILSTFWNNIMDYPELEMVEPGTVVNNIYGLYRIGWFYNENREPEVPSTITMQKAATNILGLEYKEIRPRLKKPVIQKDEKLITIAVHSTTQAKYWNNPNGWQELVDWLKSQGYRVKLLSKEGVEYMGNIAPKGVELHPNGKIEGVIEELLRSKMFIGIGSGLSWLSWSLGVPTVIISGFSEKWAEMEDCIRVEAPSEKCKGCFNRHRLDAGDWNWCPDYKGTERQYECTKSITSEMVIKKIKEILI